MLPLSKLKKPAVKKKKEKITDQIVVFWKKIRLKTRKPMRSQGVITKGISFEDEVYSREKLVAEMGAAKLSKIAGIDYRMVKKLLRIVMHLLSLV